MSHNEPVWSKCRVRLETDSPSPDSKSVDVRVNVTSQDRKVKKRAEETTQSVPPRQVVVDTTLCFDGRFLSKYCSLFPVQAIKTVRLSLRAAEPLIADNK
jgi:hypothetical protein